MRPLGPRRLDPRGWSDDGVARVTGKLYRVLQGPWTPDRAPPPHHIHYYVIYRDTLSEFSPTSSESIATVYDTFYIDCSLGIVDDRYTNYYYSVTAVNYEHNMSAASNIAGEFDKYLSNTGEDPGIDTLGIKSSIYDYRVGTK